MENASLERRSSVFPKGDPDRPMGVEEKGEAGRELEMKEERERKDPHLLPANSQDQLNETVFSVHLLLKRYKGITRESCETSVCF